VLTLDLIMNFKMSVYFDTCHSNYNRNFGVTVNL